MPDINQQIEKIVRQLSAIAANNDDEFTFRIEIESVRNIQFPIRFNFVCEETAEGHTFVNGNGATIEAAVESARADLDEACKLWGYK